MLSQAFRAFDTKAGGTISPEQFRQALDSVNRLLEDPFVPITPPQIQALVSSLPLDAGGKINYKEFMAAFEVRDTTFDA